MAWSQFRSYHKYEIDRKVSSHVSSDQAIRGCFIFKGRSMSPKDEKRFEAAYERWCNSVKNMAQYVMDQGDDDPHACIDHQSPVRLAIDTYYRLGNCRNVVRYSKTEAFDNVLKTNHYGPW